MIAQASSKAAKSKGKAQDKFCTEPAAIQAEARLKIAKCEA